MAFQLVEAPAVVDPLISPLVGAGLKPAVDLVSHGAVTGWRWWLRRYRSPTILIAGPHNAGKTTLSDYFLTGAFPRKESPMDETQDFEDRLVEIVFTGAAQQVPTSFWIRDSRGFFDAEPLVKDFQYTLPVFIYFVFDINKINRAGVATTMKYEFVEDWMEKFKMRVQEHIAVSSKTKKTLCGAAVLINKCDSIDEDEFRNKRAAFDRIVRPQFKELQPLLGFGEQRFDVFYTTMIEGKKIQRQERADSDFPWSVEFLHSMLKKGGVIK